MRVLSCSLCLLLFAGCSLWISDLERGNHQNAVLGFSDVPGGLFTFTPPLSLSGGEAFVTGLAVVPEEGSVKGAVFAVGGFDALFSFWTEGGWHNVSLPYVQDQVLWAVHFFPEFNAVLAVGSSLLVDQQACVYAYCLHGSHPNSSSFPPCNTPHTGVTMTANLKSGALDAIVGDDNGCIYVAGIPIVMEHANVTNFTTSVTRWCVHSPVWEPLGEQFPCNPNFCAGYASGASELVFDASIGLVAAGRFLLEEGGPGINVAILSNYTTSSENAVWAPACGGTGGGDAGAIVFALAIDNYGNIFAGGSLVSLGALAWCVRGATSWASLTSPVVDLSTVHSILISNSNSAIWLGGSFYDVLTEQTYFLGLWNPDNGTWGFYSHLSSPVMNLANGTIDSAVFPPTPTPTSARVFSTVEIVIVACVGVITLTLLSLAVRSFWSYLNREFESLLADYASEASVSAAEIRDLGDSDSLVIPNRSIKVIRHLASGTSGSVFLGKWHNSLVAVKQYHNLHARHEFLTESKLHAHLRHPCVVQLLGVMVGDRLATVTEYMSRGSLYKVLKERNVELSWQQRLEWAQDIAMGMEYLHSRDIIHRDLKSLNLLIDDKGKCKVADFGLSRQGASVMTVAAGTLLWTAPEVWSGEGRYTDKADVYSYGIVLWELLTREEPHRDRQGPLIAAIINEQLRPSVPPSCPILYRQLMEQCWHADPKKRPSFNDIITELLPKIHASDFQNYRPESKSSLEQLKSKITAPFRAAGSVGSRSSVEAAGMGDETLHSVAITAGNGGNSTRSSVRGEGEYVRVEMSDAASRSSGERGQRTSIN